MATKHDSTKHRQREQKKQTRSSGAVSAEQESVYAMLRTIVEVIGNVVGDNVEVVLHDLTQPEHSVLKIVNGHISERSVGDSILSGPGNDKGFLEQLNQEPVDQRASHSIIDNYQTITRNGLVLQSSTVIFRNSQGTAFASICMNVDMSVVNQAHALLQSMLHKRQEHEPRQGAPQSIDVLMKEIIADSLRKHGGRGPAMNKEAKIRAVEVMMQRGLFLVKGGVERASEALGVTRFTIYNYIDVLRHRNPDITRPAAESMQDDHGN